MTRRQLQAWLDRSGTTLYRLARDLDVSTSTPSRWREEVPGYARFYGVAMAVMTPEQREAVRRALEEGWPEPEGRAL